MSFWLRVRHLLGQAWLSLRRRDSRDVLGEPLSAGDELGLGLDGRTRGVQGARHQRLRPRTADPVSDRVRLRRRSSAGARRLPALPRASTSRAPPLNSAASASRAIPRRVSCGRAARIASTSLPAEGGPGPLARRHLSPAGRRRVPALPRRSIRRSKASRDHLFLEPRGSRERRTRAASRLPARRRSRIPAIPSAAQDRQRLARAVLRGLLYLFARRATEALAVTSRPYSAENRRAQDFAREFRLASARAAAASRSARARSATSRRTASASCTGFPGSTRRPVSSCRIASGMPPMAVAITGMPASIASAIARP